MERPRVLVVDDSEITRELVRGVLEDGGYEVTVLDSPIGFTSALDRYRPDLVLMDVTMPSLEGDQLVDLVHRGQGPCCPIVLHSDRPEEELARRARDCGAHGYIRKGGDAMLLLSAVDRFLHR